jgi:hypothetical protein
MRLKPQCEAILITWDGPAKPGERCPGESNDQIAGRHVCWLHKLAANGPRTVSECPLMFVPLPSLGTRT